MKKLLISLAILAGYANAEIINLKCSNLKSGVNIYLDINQEVAWLDDFVPIYVLKVSPNLIRGYSHNQFSTDELKIITNTMLTARLEMFHRKVSQFEINRSTLDFYSKSGVANSVKGHGKCNITNNNNKI